MSSNPVAGLRPEHTLEFRRKLYGWRSSGVGRYTCQTSVACRRSRLNVQLFPFREWH